MSKLKVIAHSMALVDSDSVTATAGPVQGQDDPARPQQLRIAFFGHDAHESTIAKRVRAFQANGGRVLGFMFRRERDGEVQAPAWDNVDLGVTVDRNYLQRVPKLLAAIIHIWRRRRLLAVCDVFYARNIDMLAIATAARALTGSKAALAYEVLDVQRALLGEGLVSRCLRWSERMLLRRCDTLVVSSPDFLSRYFEPRQHYHGPTFLLENKVSPKADARGAATATARAAAGAPWVIGWFGTLRCTRSLQILCHVADALGERVAIHIRGRLSEEDLTQRQIEEACRARPNILFGGPYRNPDDLAAIYGAVHFSWCVDYLDAGTNSDWLLPNRIYEGGLHGALALAREGTATSRKVEQAGLGWTLAEPLEESTVAFLRAIDGQEYDRRARSVAALPQSMFVDETDTRALLARLSTCSRRRRTGEVT